MAPAQGSETVLLVDTCGERGSVALAAGEQILARVSLPERAASAGLLGAVREVLAAGRTALADLGAVGVVNGPGSFTGVRVGLAVAKGLCEAAGLPVAAVSRLEVLTAAAALHDGFALLRASRDQVYVRDVRADKGLGERLLTLEALRSRVSGGELVCAEAAVLPLLDGMGIVARYVEIGAAEALGPVRRCLAAGGSVPESVDANYVRDEDAIYARPHR